MYTVYCIYIRILYIIYTVYCILYILYTVFVYVYCICIRILYLYTYIYCICILYMYTVYVYVYCRCTSMYPGKCGLHHAYCLPCLSHVCTYITSLMYVQCVCVCVCASFGSCGLQTQKRSAGTLQSAPPSCKTGHFPPAQRAPA